MGKTVTIQEVEESIKEIHYFTGAQAAFGATGAEFDRTHPLSQITFCVLVLDNGFTVTGQSACADPENFDAQKGKSIAYADALRGVWTVKGYELRSKMAAEGM